MRIDDSRARRWRAWLFSAGVPCLALFPPGAAAQEASRPDAVSAPAAAASAPSQQPQRDEPTRLAPVEVRGAGTDDTQLRRQSTAAKITIGREQIERFGDSTVGDLLKRLPGVTMQGRPGRGGNIRMRGLGSGYTQILLDGERVPPGFAIDSLSPEQIERIEIQRAPTAETGARAIAGTINIITREGFSRKLNDVRLTASFENDALQPGVSWTRNGDAGGLPYNYSLSLFRNDRRNDSATTTELRDSASDTLLRSERESNVVREVRQGVHASGRLQWFGEAGRSVFMMPLLIYSGGNTRRDAALQHASSTPGSLPAFDTAHSDGSGNFHLLRLNGVGTQRFSESDRLELRAGAYQNRFRGRNLRQETGGTAPDAIADQTDNVERGGNLAAKWTLLPGDGEHSLVGGTELEASRRTEARLAFEDGLPVLQDFDENLTARVARVAVYAQDEWSVSPNWAVHAGLRWEGITTRGSGDSSNPSVTNRSRVWSPLLHVLWKPDPVGRDQLRASVTRSYRSPSLNSMIARPTINSQARPPLANTALTADRAGNPNLRPELATGLDLAVEHYAPEGGLFSANVFQRRITNYMRSITLLEDVSWGQGVAQRYVARTRNVGDALTRGVELEAKFRLDTLLAGAPRVDVRANASVFRSKVDAVPGPDNRIDQQPAWTANFGADYRVPATPLTLGGNLNLTPGYTTRLSEAQLATVNGKIGADAYVLWIVEPGFQIRLTASNLATRDYITGGQVDAGSSRESSTTVAPTYSSVQLRLELKL